MATTSARMLRLLSLLQTHRFWPGPDLAGRLEVSDRTLRRDVERLRSLGYPVDATRGIDGGYQLRAGAAVPPLLLENDEALAIAIGLQAATVQTLDGDGDAALRALTKVVSVLPASLRAQMDAFQQTSTVAPRHRSGPRISTSTLTTLSQACRDRMPARFDYRAKDGEHSDRFVEPHALVALETRWYLLAFDRDRDDWRTFRLDRIGQVTTSTLTFREREIPGGSALEFVRANTRNVPRRHHLEVRLRADPDAVRQFLGSWGEVTPEADGWCRWTGATDELGWATALLVALDCRVEPVAPPELCAALSRVGENLIPRTG